MAEATTQQRSTAGIVVVRPTPAGVHTSLAGKSVIVVDINRGQAVDTMTTGAFLWCRELPGGITYLAPGREAPEPEAPEPEAPEW